MPEKPRVISASRRPDGTVRKAVKIRPGFRSEELDQVKYKSKGAKIAEKLRNHVPGAPKPKPKEDPAKNSSRAARRKRKKERERQERAGGGAAPQASGGVKEVEEKMQRLDVKGQEASADPAVEKKKALRKLNKKLRQIAGLEERVAKGEELTPEQKGKLAQKADIEKQVAELG